MDFHDLLKKIGSLDIQVALCKGDKKEAIHTLPDTSIAAESDTQLYIIFNE